LQRAFDTAQIISRIIKRPIIKEILARERSAGDAEGKMEEEIDWEAYEQRPPLSRKHKNGESFLEVYKRAEKCIKKLQKKYKNKTILIVSHSVFILMCLAFLKHKTIEYMLHNQPKKRVLLIEN
jgi:broad specificity phosphatase PhoE